MSLLLHQLIYVVADFELLIGVSRPIATSVQHDDPRFCGLRGTD